ncbi:MAG: hypothetical protein ACYSRP_04385 [Planctomycetota bacterium]|jgi:hypothetical protein
MRPDTYEYNFEDIAPGTWTISAEEHSLVSRMVEPELHRLWGTSCERRELRVGENEIWFTVGEEGCSIVGSFPGDDTPRRRPPANVVIYIQKPVDGPGIRDMQLTDCTTPFSWKFELRDPLRGGLGYPYSFFKDTPELTPVIINSRGYCVFQEKFSELKAGIWNITIKESDPENPIIRRWDLLQHPVELIVVGENTNTLYFTTGDNSETREPPFP